MAFRNVMIDSPARAMEILLGKLTQADESFQCEQLSIF